HGEARHVVIVIARGQPDGDGSRRGEDPRGKVLNVYLARDRARGIAHAGILVRTARWRRLTGDSPRMALECNETQGAAPLADPSPTSLWCIVATTRRD